MWPLFKKYQLGESVIPQKYPRNDDVGCRTALKCPLLPKHMHKEVSKMWGASNEELTEFTGHSCIDWLLE